MHRRLYVNDDLTKCISFGHTTFAESSEGFEGPKETLEDRILILAEKKFARDKRKPDAYSISEVTNFYVVEFIYVTAAYKDLFVKKEEAAK